MSIPVTISLQKLFCYHGADEDVSEPYMWVIGFTIDGRTISHMLNSSTLIGSPSYFFAAGSHGNIGDGVGIGATRQIPAAIGRFNTTLQPIVLNFTGVTVEVPGEIGLIGVLLEENSTSDEGAEAAHQAINNLVRTEVDEAIADINLAGLPELIEQAVISGQNPEEAAQTIFSERIRRVVDRIQRYTRAVAVDAIVSRLSFPGAIVEGADPDEYMGTSIQFYNGKDLAATTHSHRIEFTDTIAHPDYMYNLHGQAWARVEYSYTPITDQVPPGRWQVTGVNYGSYRMQKYISHVGGQFGDGSPWLLSKGKVMDFIAARSHSFFVRGETGLEANVIIQQDPVNPYFPSITTTPDADPTNNLRKLPLCPLTISHINPID